MSFIELDNIRLTKAAVVFPDIFGQKISLSSEARLEEAVGLALAINLDVSYKEIVKIRNVKPATLVGQGVIDKLLEIIKNLEIELIIFDTSLTPIQQRNLEKKTASKSY